MNIDFTKFGFKSIANLGGACTVIKFAPINPENGLVDIDIVLYESKIKYLTIETYQAGKLLKIFLDSDEIIPVKFSPGSYDQLQQLVRMLSQ